MRSQVEKVPSTTGQSNDQIIKSRAAFELLFFGPQWIPNQNPEETQKVPKWSHWTTNKTKLIPTKTLWISPKNSPSTIQGIPNWFPNKSQEIPQNGFHPHQKPKKRKQKKTNSQTWGKTPTKNTQYSHGFLLNFVDAQNAILRTFAFFTRRAASNPSINATGP